MTQTLTWDQALTQTQFAIAAGLPVPSIEDYESCADCGILYKPHAGVGATNERCPGCDR